MFKKILYIISVALIGFTVVMFSLIGNMGRVHSAQIIDSYTKGDYTNAERYYSYVMDSENKFYVGDINETHIEVYSAVNSGYRKIKDKSDNEVSYYSLENTIQFTFFNLPDTFDMADVYEEDGETIKTQGGVELVFEGIETKVFFPFVNEFMDYYLEANVYEFFPFSITFNDYNTALTNAGVSTDSKIIAANIYDGKRDADNTLSINFEKNPSFNTAFFDTLNSIVEEYNALQEESIQKDTVTDERINDVQNRYIETVNNSGYAIKHDASIYLGSFDYIFSIVITCVIFAAAAVLVGFLLFKKKKVSTYIPPSQRKGTTVKPQPEQFSRDVFNVEEDDATVTEVSDEAPLEVVSETSEEESKNE